VKNSYLGTHAAEKKKDVPHHPAPWTVVAGETEMVVVN